MCWWSRNVERRAEESSLEHFEGKNFKCKTLSIEGTLRSIPDYSKEWLPERSS